MRLEPHHLTTSLADITRLRIVALLHLKGEVCVCAIVAALEIPQPKASKHLAILRSNGIIRPRRQGQWIHYKINPEIPAWANHVIDHLTSGCVTRSPYQEDSERFEGTYRNQSCAL
jgi:ArsR family transcriptional regulator